MRVTQSDILSKVADVATFSDLCENFARKYNFPVMWLYAIMYFESAHTMSPSIRGGYQNKYVGLIQFGSGAASDLGTTQYELANMTQVEQLYYVIAYFEMWLKTYKVSTVKSFADLYTLVLYPHNFVYDNSEQWSIGQQAGVLYQNGVLSKDTINKFFYDNFQTTLADRISFAAKKNFEIFFFALLFLILSYTIFKALY